MALGVFSRSSALAAKLLVHPQNSEIRFPQSGNWLSKIDLLQKYELLETWGNSSCCVLLKISRNRLRGSYVTKYVGAYSQISENFSSCFLIWLKFYYLPLFLWSFQKKNVKELVCFSHIDICHIEDFKKLCSSMVSYGIYILLVLFNQIPSQLSIFLWLRNLTCTGFLSSPPVHVGVVIWSGWNQEYWYN